MNKQADDGAKGTMDQAVPAAAAVGADGDAGAAAEKRAKGAGDPRVALRVERARRREAEDALKRALTPKGEPGADAAGAAAGGAVEFALTEDDLEKAVEDGKELTALNARIRSRLEQAQAASREEARRELAADAEASSKVGAILDEYALFKDGDRELVSDALAAVALAVGGLGAGSDEARVRQEIESVVKRFSLYKVQRNGAAAEAGTGGDEPPDGGAAGTGARPGAAAHLSGKPQVHGSFGEASAAARALATRFFQMRGR